MCCSRPRRSSTSSSAGFAARRWNCKPCCRLLERRSALGSFEDSWWTPRTCWPQHTASSAWLTRRQPSEYFKGKEEIEDGIAWIRYHFIVTCSYVADAGIRQSSSRISLASRCCGKEESKSRKFCKRFRTIANMFELCWKPPPSTTPPCQDRRYRPMQPEWQDKSRIMTWWLSAGLSPLLTVSDWGEELAVLHCSSRLG